ncbi:zinc carboxypeptidase domain-containing protein [Phthorimaea operculella]|nr:zinc carboxypeptidase domain-containing protein [Phthorimaea operculella]
MARRMTLLALLACVAAALRPHPHSSYDVSNSESMDPFVLWDDYESVERANTMRPRPHKISEKVIIKAKPPQVNVTSKTTKSDSKKKKVIKTTSINIQSHTNFIMTKKPGVVAAGNRPYFPPQTFMVDDYGWVEQPGYVQVSAPSTRKPTTTKRPRTTTRRRVASTTRRTTTTTRRPTTKAATKPATKRVTTIKRTPKQKNKQTVKTTPCPPKTGWLMEYFQSTKKKKPPNKKTPKTGWFIGLVNNVYNWVTKSAMSWFRGPRSKKDTVMAVTRPPTQTRRPPTTTTEASSWFASWLDTEEKEENEKPQQLEVETDDDGAYAVTEPSKKVKKKPLKKTYKGYQLLRAYPDAQWKVHELLDLQEDGQGSGLMWWTVPTMSGSTDLLVPPDLLEDVKDLLQSNKIDFDVVIWDLQKAITYENPRLSKKQRLELEQLRGHPLTWRRYHRYADILRYLEYLQHRNADLVELIPLGMSSEGLPLVAVKVSMPSNETLAKNARKNSKKYKLKSRMKPAVWIEGGAHAREWISPAVTTWMLHALVEGDKGLGAQTDMLELADFYILPVLNPDGYEHSHTYDRLWLKTRSRSSESDTYFNGWFPWNWGQTECVGVNTDRNWDYHWGEADASSDRCSDNYKGPHPFSEPETRAVSEFLAEHRGRIKVYLSLHAYSQSWLLPSSHAAAAFADDAELMEMGKLATAALGDMYGTKYQCLSLPAYSQARLLPSSHAAAAFADDAELMEMGKLATAALGDMYGTKYQCLSLPAYSQSWLLPSSHAAAAFADDAELLEMGKLATAALGDMYGTKYQVGTAESIRQPASGMSHDWAKARAGIKYAYHVDMRDSFGPYGFLLPGSQIVPTAKETWQGIRAMVDNLYE